MAESRTRRQRGRPSRRLAASTRSARAGAGRSVSARRIDHRAAATRLRGPGRAPEQVPERVLGLARARGSGRALAQELARGTEPGSERAPEPGRERERARGRERGQEQDRERVQEQVQEQVSHEASAGFLESVRPNSCDHLCQRSLRTRPGLNRARPRLKLRQTLRR